MASAPPRSSPSFRRMSAVGLLFLVTLIPSANPISTDTTEADAVEVKNWALKFGKSIAEWSSEATCLRKIQQNFNDLGAKVEWVDATQMLEEMRTNVLQMLKWKREAVDRIVEVAEKAASSHADDVHLKFDYINSKKLYDPREPDVDTDIVKNPEYKAMELDPHPNFYNVRVNTIESAIHVPINVYEKGSEIMNAIKWSQYLDATFRNNMAVDPSLSWQFFGSSAGFLRLYPASKWRVPEGLDLYDCRIRPWYIQAAASAKDIVILLDGSGSMTGLRKEIARNVVINILETLNNDDFVTVLRFSDVIEPVVKCFGENTLVQATEKNIREFKSRLDDLDTTDIANFTLGLTTAFELLQKYNRSREGSQCNQAIMLITDGAPYTYEEIFQKYNWPNIPVRVFTYLIGREVTDIREVNWMACANRGYYTHVANLAEVREQVEKYIPVMSRPIVLSGTHPTIWTPAYADIGDVRLTDWVWEERERAKLRKLILNEHKKQQNELDLSGEDVLVRSEEGGEDTDRGSEHDVDQDAARRGTHRKKHTVTLMTTVAVPVFDKRNYSMRVARLLGVAGTDVPISEITKLVPQYKLGVNGYSFAITNNGYLLFHPDHRPLFQEMLKPDYSSVDLTEVELVDTDLPAREFDENLLAMRKNMIDSKIGWNKLAVKIHMDNMRRVVTRNMSYYYGPIENTPFSLAIVLPETYGAYRVVGYIEVKRKEEDWAKYFSGNQWKVHPEWIYCENPQRAALSGTPVAGNEQSMKEQPRTPEDKIRYFLNEALNTQKFRWRTNSIRPPIYDKLSCEKELVQSLVFDAKATDVNSEKCGVPDLPKAIESKMIKRYGITTTFVATRSGLLRYQDYRTEEETVNSTERPFYEVHTRATEELFYKRAVDFFRINSSAFVFSVPFDAGTRNNSLVTGSHAIFLGTGKKKAPAAVVGLQFKQFAFAEAFFNTTSSCMQHCSHTCSSEELDCFVLDNNGFVIVSEIHEHTGKFFGEVDYTLFDAMVSSGIYKKVHLFDYQAICLDIIVPSGPASLMLTPLNHLRNAMSWAWSKIIMLLVQLNLYSWWSGEWVIASDYYGSDYDYDDERYLPNKTRPRPCDREFDLYEMQPRDSMEPMKGRLSMCHSTGCDKQFIVQQVPYTNLVMLVVYGMCPCEKHPTKLEQKEVEVNESVECWRMKNGLYRQRPKVCINYNPEEGEIKQCGDGYQFRASGFLLFWSLLLLSWRHQV